MKLLFSPKTDDYVQSRPESIHATIMKREDGARGTYEDPTYYLSLPHLASDVTLVQLQLMYR